MKLDETQQEQIARLLVNFSGATTNGILARFDPDTRELVSMKLSKLTNNQATCDEESLNEFAEFLYFEPVVNDQAANEPTFDETAVLERSAPIPHLPSESQTNSQTNSDSRLKTGQETPRGIDSSVENHREISFRDITGFSDQSLDSLLRAAPPELTISLLCCSPTSFVKRALSRLTPGEAEQVRLQMAESDVIEMDEMQNVHNRYCRFAMRMVDQGLIPAN